MAGRLVILEWLLGVGLTQLRIDGKRWPPSAVSSTAHKIDSPLALLASPVRPVDFVGASGIAVVNTGALSEASKRLLRRPEVPALNRSRP
jgi:hypothetical protein